LASPDTFEKAAQKAIDSERARLNKPVATPGENKSWKVQVNNPDTGNVKTVRFGDPSMPDKAYDPARRKAFRDRHNCDTADDKTTARYWSCKKW
jgi:hypothetical protein